jgi:hypothetical protein
VLSGINTASTNKIDVVYNKVSAGYIPTLFSSVTEYLSSTTWSRPSNVHYIDLYLVGGGGSGAQGVQAAATRAGGGGGGGAVIQFNRFYVGDYDTWYILIAGQSSRAETPRADCCCDSWGHGGNPTIFSPVATSFNKASLTGTDNTPLKRTLIAPAGGGGGHPCGSHGTYFATSGGQGSNGNAGGYWGWGGTGGQNDYSGAIRIGHQGYGGGGGTPGAAGGAGGGGGGAGGQASGSTGGAGKALQSPFSGTYGVGGRGGNAGANGVSGTANTGNAGNGHFGSNQLGGYGASGRAGIRMWYSS